MKVQCDKCKKEFKKNAVDIKVANVKIKDKQLQLVYLKCPSCNEVYKISLRDKEALDMMSKMSETKKRIRMNNGSNNVELGKRLQQVHNVQAEKLKMHLVKLNEKFSGTFTLVASENNQKDILNYHEKNMDSKGE